MLKRDITYEDWDGNTVTETLYFNLSIAEIVDFADTDEALDEVIKKIIETRDVKGLMDQVKKLVLMSYGERSEDGKRFVKSDEIRLAFSQTAVYDALFLELATNEAMAAAFISGIVPKNLAEELEKQQALNQVQLPPPPPQPEG